MLKAWAGSTSGAGVLGGSKNGAQFALGRPDGIGGHVRCCGEGLGFHLCLIASGRRRRKNDWSSVPAASLAGRRDWSLAISMEGLSDPKGGCSYRLLHSSHLMRPKVLQSLFLRVV